MVDSQDLSPPDKDESGHVHQQDSDEGYRQGDSDQEEKNSEGEAENQKVHDPGHKDDNDSGLSSWSEREDEETEDEEEDDFDDKDWTDDWDAMGGDYYWKGPRGEGQLAVARFGLTSATPRLSLGRRSGVPRILFESGGYTYLWNEIEDELYAITINDPSKNIVEEIKKEAWGEMTVKLVQ